MSDSSQFVATAEPVASQFDVTLDLERIDSNIQTISQVERTWSLPELPGEVKGDLASLPGVTETGLLGFLTGLDEQLRERPEPAVPELPELPNTGLDQMQIIVSSLSSNPPPQASSGDAVKRFKLEAIERGLLDMDPRNVDSSWNPEFNRIRNDMMFERYDERLRGDREGAMPLSGALKLLNDFTSPSGLLAAATQLDLWWDKDAIGEEFSRWGDKWREVGKSDNPIEWAGNLWDALTGPIDDIVLPALNIGLMFTGIGAIANTGRIGLMVARGARTIDQLGDLYRGSRWARLSGASSAVRNFEELGRASGMAMRLGRSSNGLARASGNALAKWRAATATRMVKGTVQPLMRLGFASNLEDRMGSFQGGTSLADVSDPIQDVSERLYMAGQSPVTVLPEVLIAPYNIFVPGTFIRRGEAGTDLLGRVGRGSVRALGSAPGRAAAGAAAGAAVGTVTGEDVGDIAQGAAIGAGAAAVAPRVGGLLTKDHVPGVIKSAALGAGAGALLGDTEEDWIVGGALAGVGMFGVSSRVRSIMNERLPFINRVIRGTGNAMGLMSFKPIAETQEYSIAMHRGMVSSFQSAIENAETPEAAQALRARLNKWHTNVKVSGVNHALAEELNVSGELGEEVSAAVVGWTFMSAMIDHIAVTQAKAMKGPWRGRYLMARDKLINQLRPFDMDAPTEDVLDDLATSIAMTTHTGRSRRGLAAATAKVRQRLTDDPAWALEQANAHNDKALETMHQLWNPTNLPKVDEGFGAPEALPGMQQFHSTNMEGRAVLMEQYMPQMWDTFGNWPKFTAAMTSIRQSRASGLLDEAELAPAFTRSGRRSSITDVARRERPSKDVDEAAQALEDIALTRKDPSKLTDTAVTPAAPSVLPGRFTIMEAGTKDGQELFELREQLEDLLEARSHLKRLEGLGWRRTLGEVEDIAPLNELTRGQIGRLVADFFPGQDANRSFRYITAFAKRKGVGLDGLVGAIDDEALRMADDAKLWGDFGLSPRMFDDDGRVLLGFDALAARSKDLQERIPYTAKRVDVDRLAKTYRDRGQFDKATEVENLARQLEGDGYKLVHGVEYLMQEDLAQLKPFADINERHLNYATLGNFFKGRLPVEGHIVADLRHRAALVSELSAVETFKDVTVNDDRIDNILDLTRRWVRDEQDRVEQLTRHMDVQTKTGRTINRLRSTATPVNVEDVQQRSGEIRRFLVGEGFSDEEARAITRATAKFRNTSFRDLGLYAFEAKARSGNQAAWALKLLSGANYGKGFMQRGRAHRFAGAFVGAQVGRSQFDEDDSFEDRLGKVALGVAGGVAAGTLTPNIARVAGVDRLAARARDWRYGYMADWLARTRDSLRFTLSPIFDASRYTEGYMLGQTGAPLRKANGERVVLPLNMSPRALKRQLAKQHGGADAGRRVYEARIAQFQKFARDHQDFDPEVLDSAGRWFKQVGILGFSPVDWMGTAFARLMDEGFDAQEAYDASRRMYTYATGRGIGRARSGAEMSVNYVMFPFSFQKKALTGLGKWMNDDLGRSIMIHDALKTYEVLDAEYNLEERWRDYFPWLQQLQRLNLFAYGISAGRLGGINSQLFESGGKLAWNMFVPAGLKINDVEAGTELFGTPAQREAGRFGGVMGNLVPVWNDINWMIENVTDSAHVAFSEEHVTRAAERRRGWDAWNKFKSEFDTQLRSKGYTLSDVMSDSKPWLAEARAHYEDTRTELAQRFPEWWRSRQESVSDIAAINADRQLALDRFARDTRLGVTPMLDDAMIAEFELYLEGVRKELRLRGGIDSLEDAPPDLFDQIIGKSVQNARSNPRWRSIWGRFYEKEFGPIDVVREL